MSADPGIRIMTAVRERLAAEVPAYRTTGIADDFAEMVARGELSQRMPAVYVVSRGEKAARNIAAAGAHSQVLTTRIGVVTVASRKGERAAARALNDIWELLPLELAALAGWTPGGDYTPLELVGREQISSPGRAAVFHMSEYMTMWRLRRTGS